MMTEQNYACEFRPSLWNRLFPGAPGVAVRFRSELKAEADTWLMVETRIRLDWKDRLRLLFSGCAETRTRVYTNVLVDQAYSDSTFGVLPPRSVASPVPPPEEP